MTDDTKIGGPSARFPATRWSAIFAARSEDAADRARGFEAIITAYWKPVYKYIRIRWNKSNEEAKDLTQEFFARLIEKDFLGAYDPAKAQLRTFLRVCVDGFAANQERSARRLKRGGDAVHVPLDFDAAEDELRRASLSAQESPEQLFEKEWVRSLFGLAIGDLRAECEQRGKQVHFRLFEMYDLEDGTEPRVNYEQLARQFGIGVTDVTNHLAFARREFRRIVLERLRLMTGDDDEFRREARSLLGVNPR